MKTRTKIVLGVAVVLIALGGLYYVMSGPSFPVLQRQLNEAKQKLEAITNAKAESDGKAKERETSLLKQISTINQKMTVLLKERNEYAKRSKKLEGMLANVTVASTAVGVVDELHALGYPGARVVKLPKQNR